MCVLQARLVEAGAKKLTQLYTKFVAEASSGALPERSSFDQNIPSSLVPFPDDILQTLRPLVFFLRTLPLPATHPSHPAAAPIQAALASAQRGYADMRGAWARKCLDTVVKRVLDGNAEGYRLNNNNSLDILKGGEFANWVEDALSVAEVKPILSLRVNDWLTLHVLDEERVQFTCRARSFTFSTATAGCFCVPSYTPSHDCRFITDTTYNPSKTFSSAEYVPCIVCPCSAFRSVIATSLGRLYCAANNLRVWKFCSEC